MRKGLSLTITPKAAAELGRQASFAGTPGQMHIDLLEDSFKEGWMYIRLQPGSIKGVPIARTDGVTLYAPLDQLNLLKGLTLNYYGDLSGGGFLITSPQGAESSPCGSGFKFLTSN